MPFAFIRARAAVRISLPVRPGRISSTTMSWSALALASARRRPAGRVGLAREQDVGVVLGVGVEPRDGDPDVAVEQIAALDDRIVAELFGRHAFALHFDARLEPRPQSLIVDPLPPPPHQITRLRRAGRNPLLGEHRLRHRPDELLHLLEESFLLRQPRRDQLERQPLGVLELRRPCLAEGGGHAFQLTARQAVREGEDRRSIDADDARLVRLDEGLEHLPLLVTPELGLLPAADVRRRGFGGPARLEHASLRRAAQRDPLHAGGGW
jgi:hypothetical protein